MTLLPVLYKIVETIKERENNMLNEKQYDQLLKPINPNRVSKRTGGGGKQLSYVSVWDVKAHLTRIFGFGGWSWEVTDTAFVFEEKVEDNEKMWVVAYKALGTLSIHSLNVKFAEAAVGVSRGSRGDAHDNAIKNAESDAIKRAAINLGDQFGLSLYANGSTKAIIQTTLDRDVTSQENPSESVTEVPAGIPDTPGAAVWIEEMRASVNAKDVEALLNMKKGMNEEEANDWVYQGVTLSKWFDKAIAQVGKQS